MKPQSEMEKMAEAERHVLQGYALHYVLWCQKRGLDHKNSVNQARYRREVGSDRIVHFVGEQP